MVWFEVRHEITIENEGNSNWTFDIGKNFIDGFDLEQTLPLTTTKSTLNSIRFLKNFADFFSVFSCVHAQLNKQLKNKEKTEEEKKCNEEKNKSITSRLLALKVSISVCLFLRFFFLHTIALINQQKSNAFDCFQTKTQERKNQQHEHKNIENVWPFSFDSISLFFLFALFILF